VATRTLTVAAPAPSAGPLPRGGLRTPRGAADRSERRTAGSSNVAILSHDAHRRRAHGVRRNEIGVEEAGPGRTHGWLIHGLLLIAGIGAPLLRNGCDPRRPPACRQSTARFRHLFDTKPRRPPDESHRRPELRWSGRVPRWATTRSCPASDVSGWITGEVVRTSEPRVGEDFDPSGLHKAPDAVRVVGVFVRWTTRDAGRVAVAANADAAAVLGDRAVVGLSTPASANTTGRGCP
jgi:hypothetical protein